MHLVSLALGVIHVSICSRQDPSAKKVSFSIDSEHHDIFDFDESHKGGSHRNYQIPRPIRMKPLRKKVSKLIRKGTAEGAGGEEASSSGGFLPLSSGKVFFSTLEIRPGRKFEVPVVGEVDVTDVLYEEADDSRIYRATSVKSGEDLVIKIQFGSDASSFTELDNEVEALKALHACRGVVRLIAAPAETFVSRKGKTFKYCVLEALGRSLQQLVLEEYPRGDMPIEKISLIALKGIGALEEVHAAGYIHGDIGLGNILFTDSGETSIKLIDFGYSRRYMDKKGNHVLPAGDNPLRKGERITPLSISEIDGHFPSRRDDLHRLGEVLLKLLNSNYARLLDKSRNIRDTKMGVKPSRDCRDDAKKLDDYFTVVMELKYHDTPDYAKLRELFAI